MVEKTPDFAAEDHLSAGGRGRGRGESLDLVAHKGMNPHSRVSLGSSELLSQMAQMRRGGGPGAR
jgi:hypothetical protein